MQRSWLAWSTMILGALAFIVALADLTLVLTNRAMRRETNEQRQYIQQTVQLNGVRDRLLQQSARTATEDKDQALRDLLVRHGYRFQSDPPAPAAAPPTEKK